MIGVPDYIKADRADQIDWVTNFDGTITSAEQIPNLTTPTDRLPAMTSAQMERYISLSKSDPDSAARLLELITLVNQEQE
jgi:2-hydroxy-3-keto-5-methylthiopentenyl-1-phosphate phosphatase